MGAVAVAVFLGAACGARTQLAGTVDASVGTGDAAADRGPDGLDAHDGGAGEVDDIAASFSAASNPTPTGHFRYGYTLALGGTFKIYSDEVSDQSLPFWQATTTPNTPPYVAKNDTSSTVVFHTTVTVPPATVWFHPGPSGEYSVIRWTCPHSGNYALSVAFTARDTTTTDVHVLRGGAMPPVFSGSVTTSSSPTYSSTLTLTEGEAIDFAVGYGANGTYFDDSTGVAGSLAAL
ncbi:MAG TPA: hypothetical protein VLM85_14860 [Polyangiaceae bacterium]|nr:hypothetical protein [Polyangiaceae bacterium]